MATVRRTVAITKEQHEWLEANVKAGLFADIGEHIRDLVQRELESQEETEALRQELIKGKQSPIVPFDPEEFEKEMIEKYG